MHDASGHSISRWLSGLKRGDTEAAREIFKQCFDRLIQISKARLAGTPKRAADEEDVALSVFHSLCRGAAAGRFERMQTRDDLWQILVAITQQKVVDLRRRNTRVKRGGGLVRGESVFEEKNAEGKPRRIDEFAVDDVTPEFVAMLTEEHERLLNLLRDESQRRIALLRMEGYCDEEIAAQLGVSLRTVERKLQMIREKWTREIDG